LAWAGQVVEPVWLRCILISSCFTIYAESALRQIRWTCGDKWLESGLVVYQVFMFFVYGIVYLVALANLITPFTEEVLYTSLDLSVKIIHTVIFALMHRAEAVDLRFGALRNYLDILVGFRALVGAQFDFVINCEVTSLGLVITSTSASLSSSIGKPLYNRPLEEICFRDADRCTLRSHGLAQSSPSSDQTANSPWERQEALARVADMLRIDIPWVESPGGSSAAELFVAVAAGEKRLGDAVVLGLKLCPIEVQPEWEMTSQLSDFTEISGFQEVQTPMMTPMMSNRSTPTCSTGW